jgi:SAM-dependent methyltransferase
MPAPNGSLLATSRNGPAQQFGCAGLRPLPAPDRSIPMLARRVGSWRFVIERDPLPVEALQRRYAARAARYGRMLQRLGFTTAYAELAQRFAAQAQDVLRTGARVLDCGSGSGALSLALASATNVVLRHHILDSSAAMLRVASDALAARGLRADVALADVRAIPHASGRFDAVVAAHVIEHLPDPVEALREMRRVARPGARALVVVTRCGLLGSAVQLRWRVHCATRQRLQAWLERSGWSELQFIGLEGPWWCDRMSIACMAARSLDLDEPHS